MASKIEKWVERTQAALLAGKIPRLPTDSEFEKMSHALRTAEVTLSFWWGDDKAECEISMPFFQWLRIVRGERYEQELPAEPFEGDTLHPALIFSSGCFSLVDYENGADYHRGDLEDLCIDSPTAGVDDLACLVLCLQRANARDEGD